MRVVAALGGNALLRRGECADAYAQRANVAVAVKALAEIARAHELVVTHGNGPQIGLLALQAEAYEAVPAYPLDVLDAESEGMIGYLLEQELGNVLAPRTAATLLTQVVVDASDPAFSEPTKPIGPIYDATTAQGLARARGWSVTRDGSAWRRVVASPQPQRIVEIAAIRTLLGAGVIVVCVGGGGIPVVVDRQGRLRGVEAVIDKDRSAALLARELDADALLLLTDVPAIELHWGTPAAQPLSALTTGEVRQMALASGSMGPKATAAAWYVEQTGGYAAIGALADAAEVLAGHAGTRVLPTATLLTAAAP